MSECKHDYEHPVRRGRADYRCSKCGEDITITLALVAEAEEEIKGDC